MRLLTVVTVVLGSVPVIAAPASAAAMCDRPSSFTAQAQADLLKVGLLDLRPLGLNLPQVVGLTLASSRAGMATDAAVRSNASAQYIDAAVAGLKLPAGPLEARVAQQAPPTHQDAVRNNALSVDLGLAKVGTGDLMAHAEWAEGMACGRQLGRAGSSSAAILEATVLPGSSGAMVKASRNLSSQAGTAILARKGHIAAAAGAEVGLAKVELFGAGAAAVTVRVVEPPQLMAVATGRKETSSVEYKAPLLEISGPGIGTRQLSGMGQAIDLPLPTTALGTVLNGLSLGQVASLTQLGEATMVRLTIGNLEQKITDGKVTASAASLRLQVLAAGASLLDLSVGLLQVSASAPRLTEPAPPNDCGTPGCKLPVTGLNIGLAAGVGVVLFLVGHFLLVLAGRRTPRRP